MVQIVIPMHERGYSLKSRIKISYYWIIFFLLRVNRSFENVYVYILWLKKNLGQLQTSYFAKSCLFFEVVRYEYKWRWLAGSKVNLLL
jgi:hypothetical protein